MEEKLSNDNQYLAQGTCRPLKCRGYVIRVTGFGKQDAIKGVGFLSFPPVLHLHLKRFEYDVNAGEEIRKYL